MRKKIINGKEIILQEVEPLTSQEFWNIYQMPNGDILKIKLVVARIWSANMKNAAGEPLYEIASQNMTIAIAGKE